MRRIFLAAFALLLAASSAYAITLTLPAVVFTSPPSTSIACTETAAANLVVPVAVGTVIFNCTVSPTAWNGTVVAPLLAAPFTTTAVVGNTFNVTLSAGVTAPATDAPGTLSVSP